jgi:hypothetical protein
MPELPIKQYVQTKNPEDTPEEWLLTSMTFARALGFLLKENEGVVVKTVGDMKMLTDARQLIVYSADGQIIINDHSEQEDFPDGQLVWMD